MQTPVEWLESRFDDIWERYGEIHHYDDMVQFQVDIYRVMNISGSGYHHDYRPSGTFIMVKNDSAFWDAHFTEDSDGYLKPLYQNHVANELIGTSS
jgi:hypothetical protein